MLAPISPVAWLPVAMLIFGIGNAPAIFLVFIALFFIMTLATLSLIDNLPVAYIQVARIMGANRRQIFFQVILPAILPGLFVVLRLNLFAAWMIVLIAESVGVGGGLGLVVIVARNTFDAQLAFFTMFVIGVVGFALEARAAPGSDTVARLGAAGTGRHQAMSQSATAAQVAAAPAVRCTAVSKVWGVPAPTARWRR